MYNRYGTEWDRAVREEERRLLREVTGEGPMTWRKFGKMIQLNAMLRAHDRDRYGIYGDHRNYF